MVITILQIPCLKYSCCLVVCFMCLAMALSMPILYVIRSIPGPTEVYLYGQDVVLLGTVSRYDSVQFKDIMQQNRSQTRMWGRNGCGYLAGDSLLGVIVVQGQWWLREGHPFRKANWASNRHRTRWRPSTLRWFRPICHGHALL